VEVQSENQYRQLMTTQPPTIVTNVITQLIGVGLTVFGLGFTVATPVLARLDLLSTSVARLEVTNQGYVNVTNALEKRISALEIQAANNREAIIRLKGGYSDDQPAR
jgi:hypothetical protein